MKRIIIFVFGICFMACSKDDEGALSSGTTLISIEYTDENDSWVENYFYASNGKPGKIEDSRSLGTRYEMDYQNGQLKEFLTYVMDKNELVFRDSILYNPNGTIQAIYHFSINSGEDLPLSLIYKFEYNSDNKVSKKSTYLVATGENTSIEKYYWNRNNIERVEYYNGNEKLYYEYFYKYDDKVNYNRGFPPALSDPVNWSDNNITEMNWNDYLGNLDLICRPCIAEYNYNLDDYPVGIKFNWGRKMKLIYE